MSSSSDNLQLSACVLLFICPLVSSGKAATHSRLNVSYFIIAAAFFTFLLVSNKKCCSLDTFTGSFSVSLWSVFMQLSICGLQLFPCEQLIDWTVLKVKSLFKSLDLLPAGFAPIVLLCLPASLFILYLLFVVVAFTWSDCSLKVSTEKCVEIGRLLDIIVSLTKIMFLWCLYFDWGGQNGCGWCLEMSV